jgi:hypothetical protein
MQGTVASFDAASRTGHVLTDDGVRLDYPAEALAEHVRHLRVGQRVFVDLDPDAAETPGRPRVTHVAIWR